MMLYIWTVNTVHQTVHQTQTLDSVATTCRQQALIQVRKEPSTTYYTGRSTWTWSCMKHTMLSLAQDDPTGPWLVRLSVGNFKGRHDSRLAWPPWLLPTERLITSGYGHACHAR